jgi:hypothetical protein
MRRAGFSGCTWFLRRRGFPALRTCLSFINALISLLRLRLCCAPLLQFIKPVPGKTSDAGYIWFGTSALGWRNGAVLPKTVKTPSAGVQQRSRR